MQQKQNTNDVTEEEPSESVVSSRASGRPPEESDSDCPEDQAREILEESEERTRTSAQRSDKVG